MPQKIKPELGSGVAKFQEDVFQKILDERQSKEEEFEAAKTKEYPDPFKID